MTGICKQSKSSEQPVLARAFIPPRFNYQRLIKVYTQKNQLSTPSLTTYLPTGTGVCPASAKQLLCLSAKTEHINFMCSNRAFSASEIAARQMGSSLKLLYKLELGLRPIRNFHNNHSDRKS